MMMPSIFGENLFDDFMTTPWEREFFGGKNPFLMVEYRLVPLMVSVVKIGDELSAAALTRGLGAPVRRTNVCQIGFHFQDVVAILFCIICFVLFLLQQQIAF